MICRAREWCRPGDAGETINFDKIQNNFYRTLSELSGSEVTCILKNLENEPNYTPISFHLSPSELEFKAEYSICVLREDSRVCSISPE